MLISLSASLEQIHDVGRSLDALEQLAPRAFVCGNLQTQEEGMRDARREAEQHLDSGHLLH